MLFEKCIAAHKEHDRFMMVTKEDIKKFLETEFGEKINTKMTKAEIVSIAYQHLSRDTVDLFTHKLRNFGLTRQDIAEVLEISQYRATKLTQDGTISKIGEYINTHSDLKIPYYIYSISDVLAVKIDPKYKKAAPALLESTDQNIAEALYAINKSAKVSRDTKVAMYEAGRHSICRSAKTRSNNLYNLKDDVIRKLVKEDRINLLGYHTSELGYLELYEIAGFTFHVPCYRIAEGETCLGKLDTVISAEKTRKTCINFNQAVALLKDYVKAS